jgi:hypothetical protein
MNCEVGKRHSMLKAVFGYAPRRWNRLLIKRKMDKLIINNIEHEVEIISVEYGDTLVGYEVNNVLQ